MDNQNIPNQMPSDRFSRIERRRQRRGGSITGGFFLIGLAVMLLLQNMNVLSFGRWWALLIMIPAIGAFVNAWKEYQAADKQLTQRASSAVIGGLILTALTGALLFNMDWGWFGPALLLLAGAGFLGRSLLSTKNE